MNLWRNIRTDSFRVSYVIIIITYYARRWGGFTFCEVSIANNPLFQQRLSKVFGLSSLRVCLSEFSAIRRIILGTYSSFRCWIFSSFSQYFTVGNPSLGRNGFWILIQRPTMAVSTPKVAKYKKIGVSSQFRLTSWSVCMLTYFWSIPNHTVRKNRGY